MRQLPRASRGAVHAAVRSRRLRPVPPPSPPCSWHASSALRTSTSASSGSCSRSAPGAQQELKQATTVVVVEAATAVSESKTASLLVVDSACMKKLELSGVFGTVTSSFMRIICCQSLRVQAQVTMPSRLAVAFFRKHNNVFLSMADNKSMGTCVWSENNNVALALSDCFTCQHNSHI